MVVVVVVVVVIVVVVVVVEVCCLPRGWIVVKAYYVILGNQIPISFLLHGKH
jgi:hypothetical protein